MKYLLILLLATSLQAVAQPALEFGINGGVSLPNHHANPGYSAGVSASILPSRFKKPLTLEFGIRHMIASFTTNAGYNKWGVYEGSASYFMHAIATSANVNYHTPLSKNTELRLSLGGGVFADFSNNFYEGNTYAEASAGALFNKKITLGAKFCVPFEQFGAWAWNTPHNMSCLMLDIRYMLPKGRVINNKSQWQRAKEQQAEMAVRHKKIKEEKAKHPHRKPHIELGLSGGVSFTSDVDNYLPYNAVVPNTMPALLFITNIHIDKRGKPVAFTFGTRIGATGGEVGLGTTLGIKYETEGEATFRTSLTVGPSFYFYSSGKNTGIGGNVSTELSAGTMLWHRLYVGVKYLQPFFKTTETATNWSYVHSYQYMQSLLLADIAVRLGGKY